MTLLPFEHHVSLTNIKVKVIFPSEKHMEDLLVARNEIEASNILLFMNDVKF